MFVVCVLHLEQKESLVLYSPVFVHIPPPQNIFINAVIACHLIL